jgi:gliding motility-associated-like protein
VYLPNAFTPNADGINDRWAPVGDAWFSLNIYDRWGNLLHQQQGTTVGWDGLDYPQGVYAYSLSYSRCDGPIFHKGGHISLIR